MTEVISINELKEKLNSLIQETMTEEKEPDLDFFSDNKASQKKKRNPRKDTVKTLQHGKNKS